MNLAFINSKLNDYNASLYYYNRLLEIYERNKQFYIQEIASTLSNIEFVYLRLDNPKETSSYLEKSYKNISDNLIGSILTIT